MSKFSYLKPVLELGSGSFGNVVLVENSEKKRFALKTLLPKHVDNISKNQRVLTYFLREINIMRKYCHPNLVQLVDSCFEEGCYQILMEYCDDGNLQSYLKKLRDNNEFNEQKILDFFYQITTGFDYLHKLNIIHRDIKPDNILVDNGIAKIADFGLSIALDDDKNIATTFVGTRITMAPEVLNRDPYTNKVDIYSLGVLLYYMFYGVFPFKGPNEFQLTQAIKKGNIVFDQEKFPISEETQELIRLMTQYEAEKRPDIHTIRQFPCFSHLYKEELRKNEENLENMMKSCSGLDIQVNEIVNPASQNNNDSPTFNKENTQIADQQVQHVQNNQPDLPMNNNEIHLINANNKQNLKKQYQFCRVKNEQIRNFLGLDGPDPNQMSTFEFIFSADNNYEIQSNISNYRCVASNFHEFIKKDLEILSLTMNNIILNLQKQWGQRLIALENKYSDKDELLNSIQISGAELCCSYFRRMNRVKEEQQKSHYFALQLLVWNLVQLAGGKEIDCQSGFELFNFRVQTISLEQKDLYIESTPFLLPQ